MTASGPWDLGDTVRLTASATDAAGNATNCTTMVATITLPDGTPATPAVTNPPLTTGAYQTDYVTTAAGRHKIRWVGTNPAFAYSDIFDVLPADPQFVISLADAREALRKPGGETIDDPELRLYTAAVTTVVEAIVGPQTVTTRTIARSGGKSAILLPNSAVSVTQVTENGNVLDADGGGYTVDLDAGIVYRGNQVQPFQFLPGHDNISITYTAGANIVASNIRLAARIILKHLWTADQANVRVTMRQAGEEPTVNIAGYAVPYRAASLLEPTPDLIPGFA